MNRALARIYAHLPPGGRSVAATFRGFQLARWRYGPETDASVEEALAREHWTAEQWGTWRDERLGRLLHHAATQVPAYRDRWARRRRAGDRASWELLANWPVLTKDEVRREPRAFLAEDSASGRLFHEFTSGTTGKPMELWFDRAAVRAWYALFEARWRRWYGVSRRDRWAMLGGQLVVPATRRTPPFWVWNGAMRQLYMSSYHLAPDLVPHYLDQLKRRRVRYLLGYASSLTALAKGALAAGVRLPGLQLALTNAEPLLPSQRAVMEEAFDCEVRETYGMSEAVAAASECAAGVMHSWPEAGLLEAGEGPGGTLVSTGLLNRAMPLVRYAVGDKVAAAPPSLVCACGRTLPQLGEVEGRSDDVLLTADGRSIGRLDPAFKADLRVREAQIEQETLGRVRVRVVPDLGYTTADAERIRNSIRERMGDIEVLVEVVESIARGSNGKFRAVICSLSAETRRGLVGS